MSNRIVYKQDELEAAFADGVKKITLCAGVFNIPMAANVCFDRIGPVKVGVQCTRMEADAAGMRFEGIYPDYRHSYAAESRASMAVVAAFSSGSGGSFVTSGSGSYGSGTYGSGSFGSGANYYEYEFEFEHGSFARGSRTGSMGTSFSLSGSFKCAGSINTAAQTDERGIMRVYGYGINLI